MGFSFNRQSLTSRGSGTITAIPVGSLVVDKADVSVSTFAGASAETFTDADQVFTLSNGGPGNWDNPQYSIAYSDSTGWLSFTPTLSAGALLFQPTVDSTALVASEQIATVTFTDARVSNSGAVSVSVTVTVASSAPSIALSPSTLAFSIVDETPIGTAKTVTISNGALSGTLAVPTVGTITGAGAAYIDSADISGASPGPYTLTITPTAIGGTPGVDYPVDFPIYASGASNSPRSVTATVTVTGAQQAFIILDRSLDDASGDVGGASPAPITVGIRSGNAIPLAGPTVTIVDYVGAHSGWCTPTITGGALTSTFNTAGITTGGATYCNMLVGDANAGAAQPYAVYLKMGAVTTAPAMNVIPSGVSRAVVAGQNVAQTSVVVSSLSGPLSGLGTITAAFTTAIAWCSVAFSVDTATLTFTTAALSDGTYNAVLRVEASLAGNTPIDVPVQVVVTTASGNYDAPAWTLPSHITFSTSTDELSGDLFSKPAVGDFS